MTLFKNLLALEGILLTLVGPIHIIYLIFFGDATIETAPYWGVIGIGIFYTGFGISFLAGKTVLLLPALIINGFGLTGVLVMWEASPLWSIDPYLIAVDIISIPTLIYLNKQKKHLRNYEQVEVVKGFRRDN